MIRQEIVEDEKWISREQFNRVLAVYQVLPGPEAHELCVHFGMLSGGRIGGFLAGLGFMLPGFVLMFLLSAAYASGLRSAVFNAFFLGIQPAVVALIVRAVHRIGQHAVTNRWLFAIATVAGIAHFVGTSFWVTLPLAGLVYLFSLRKSYAAAAMVGVLLLVGIVFLSGFEITPEGVQVSPLTGIEANRVGPPAPGEDATTETMSRPPLFRLFISGLRAGLLTFGGAYTVLPFLQHDAVAIGRWMTDRQFLDGVALSGILPAPFIIFSTFVGYLGGGPIGSLLLTIGIFLPAFSFTLVGHWLLERIIGNRMIHTFLEGVTAGVVGLIGATTITLFRVGVRDLATFLIFSVALFTLYRWKAKGAVAVVCLTAGIVGLVFLR
jgi:chromate transporter